MNQFYTVGWDLGGAHLKAALLDKNNRIKQTWQLACPLWKGTDFLEDSVNKVLAELPSQVVHALTMSGELVDFFENRLEGVRAIIGAMKKLLSPNQVLVYQAREGLVKCEQEFDPLQSELIASANWLVSSAYVASQVKRGLFIDIGSTTTDIILFDNNSVLPTGLTDYERLCSGELIYSGVVRTPLMALAETIKFQSRDVALMAELFASSADVYRLTDQLPDGVDLMPTADGRSKNKKDSARRIARMIGRDLSSATLDDWVDLAHQFKQKQLARIEHGCRTQLGRLSEKASNDLVIVGAGVGCFLVEELAQILSCRYIPFDHYIPVENTQFEFSPGDCAPAVSVALLNSSQTYS